MDSSRGREMNDPDMRSYSARIQSGLGRQSPGPPGVLECGAPPNCPIYYSHADNAFYGLSMQAEDRMDAGRSVGFLAKRTGTNGRASMQIAEATNGTPGVATPRMYSPGFTSKSLPNARLTSSRSKENRLTVGR